MAKTKKKKEAQIANLYPKLKQRQRMLHSLRALIRFIKLAVSCAAFYGIYLLWNMPFWQVESVQLNGLSRIGYDYVSKFSLEKSYKGKNILDVNPAKVNNILQNIRLFKEIKTSRSVFPTVLSIEFIERTPYLSIYEATSGSEVVIDDEGVTLTSSKNTGKEVKPVYSIKIIKNNKISAEQLNDIKVIEKLRYYKKIKDFGTYDITNPKNIILKTQENHILLGNLDNFVTKIETIPVIESLSKKNKDELEYIDIRYWRNPVLKLKGSGSYEK